VYSTGIFSEAVFGQFLQWISDSCKGEITMTGLEIALLVGIVLVYGGLKVGNITINIGKFGNRED
jgi:hypothetical protein